MITQSAYHAAVRAGDEDQGTSYVYQFSHVVPDTPERMAANGAFHTGDVSYWLDYYSPTWNRPWTDVDRALGDAMSDLLVDFATDGVVEGWPAHDGTETAVEYMHLDDTAQVAALDEATTALWAQHWGG